MSTRRRILQSARRPARQVRSLLRWLVRGREDGVRSRLAGALGLKRSNAPAEGNDVRRDAAPPVEAELPSMDGWVHLVRVDEIGPGEVLEVMAGERALALARTDEGFFAVADVCPHAGGPLGDGELDGCQLTCPWHGWSFDVRDGSCGVDPSLHVETVEVRVEHGAVWAPAS